MSAAVLDASAALEISLGRQMAPLCMSLLESAETVLAPSLMIAECTNALWKYHRFGGVEMVVCREALDRALGIADEYAPDEELAGDALVLAAGAVHAAYDMFYVALAMRTGGGLLTFDKKLGSLALERGVKLLIPAS